jgi:RNA polymerase sigma factor (sigma-70 family)
VAVPRSPSAAPRNPSEASLTHQWTADTPTDDEAADAARAGAGDRDAFERLYRRHVSRIHGLARRMAGGEAADDLTQDVFVRAWEKLHTFRAESRFGTWLYRVAVNVIVEDRRKRANAWRQVDDEAAIANVPVAPPDTPLSVDLAAAVDLLPDGARQVFVLHDVQGFKHREIGKLFGITTGTSKGQLHRARMVLRRYLGSSDGDAGER